jgi:hypothetical protein
MRKKILQKHQVAAFNKTLVKIEADLSSKIRFIEHYNDVYKFPAAITRDNLRTYKRQLKAIEKLKNYSK